MATYVQPLYNKLLITDGNSIDDYEWEVFRSVGNLILKTWIDPNVNTNYLSIDGINLEQSKLSSLNKFSDQSNYNQYYIGVNETYNDQAYPTIYINFGKITVDEFLSKYKNKYLEYSLISSDIVINQIIKGRAIIKLVSRGQNNTYLTFQSDPNTKLLESSMSTPENRLWMIEANSSGDTLVVHNSVLATISITLTGSSEGGSEEGSYNYYIIDKQDEDEGNPRRAISRATGSLSIKGGDIAVVRKELSDGSLAGDEFIYDESSDQWIALTGEYDWSTVYATSDLVVTKEVGTIVIPASGHATLPTNGKTIKQVFEMILAEEKLPVVTQPSITLTLTNAKAYEVGSTVSPGFNWTYDPGSYTYGPETGVIGVRLKLYHNAANDADAITWQTNDWSTNRGTQSGRPGTFPNYGNLDNIIVNSSTNYKLTMVWQHTQGTNPLTNLGNDATLDNSTGSTVDAIQRVTSPELITQSSGSITGYIMGRFYGTLTSVVDSDTITSAQVRSLTKNNSSTTTGTWSFTVPVGARTIIIAVKGNRTLTQVLNTTVNADMTASFTKSTNLVTVAGADNNLTSGNQNDYSIWTYSPAEAYASTASLTIKVS